MKKQRTFWMDDKDFNRLKSKIRQYYRGKGSLERFMEKIVYENIIFIQGDGVLQLKVLK